ncbi:MAG: VOC family protein [Pseudomonadota bacterium]
MRTTLHHVHLFSSDMDKSLHFYREMFGARTIFDREMAGSRNVLIAIGNGKINLYDRPPKDPGRGAVHHLGIETDDLETLVEHMKRKGYSFSGSIKDYRSWRYIMAEAPDSVLLELFQIVAEEMGGVRYEGFSSL